MNKYEQELKQLIYGSGNHESKTRPGNKTPTETSRGYSSADPGGTKDTQHDHGEVK